MKKIFLFFLFALLLLGCGDDLSFHDRVVFYDTSSNEHWVTIASYPGELTCAVVIDLDSALDTVSQKKVSVDTMSWNGRTTAGFIMSQDDFTSPYKLIRVDFVEEDSLGKESRSLYWLASSYYDQGFAIQRASISRMGSILVGRMMQLMKDGYPYEAAWGVAKTELNRIFNISENNTKGIWDIIDLDYMEDFMDDFKDGVIDDSLKLVEKADQILAEYFSAYSRFEEFELSFKVRYVNKYLGLDSCKKIGSWQVVSNKLSAYFQDSVFCADGDVQHPRLPDSLDREFGICAPDSSDSKKIECRSDSTCFSCAWVAFGAPWRPSSVSEWLDHYYYPCDSTRWNDRIQYRDSIFECSAFSAQWWLNKVDSLNYALGECTEDRLWEVQMFNERSYSCTDSSKWTLTTASSYLKSLRPCDALKNDEEAFRVEMYVAKTDSSQDTTYYHCGDYSPDARDGGLLKIDEKHAKMLMESARLMEEEECNESIVHKTVRNEELDIYFVCRTWYDGYHWYEAEELDIKDPGY